MILSSYQNAKGRLARRPENIVCMITKSTKYKVCAREDLGDHTYIYKYCYKDCQIRIFVVISGGHQTSGQSWILHILKFGQQVDGRGLASGVSCEVGDD
jgi:hypothetical protein